MNVIAEDGQLITKRLREAPRLSGGRAVSDVSRDIVKLVVINRYRDVPPAVGFIPAPAGGRANVRPGRVRGRGKIFRVRQTCKETRFKAEGLLVVHGASGHS